MASPYHVRSRLRENPHPHPPFLSRRHESGTALEPRHSVSRITPGRIP